MSHVGVVISEIWPNKLKVAKSLKWNNFRRTFEATTVLACFGKLKSRFKLIGRSTNISYISSVNS